MQKKVVIFGGRGFIGQYIASALLNAGMDVTITSRRKNAPYHYCDIHSDASVNDALVRAHYAVYLPGLLFEKGRDSNFQTIHIDAAERVAKACARNNIKCLVHMSSLGASPHSPALYSRTKAEGERHVLAAFPHTAILRPSVVFGAEDNFLNQFATMAKIAPVLPLVGGDTKFQPVFVGDIALAVAAIFAAPTQYAGKIFELGGPTVYSFRDILTDMLRITGQRAYLLPIPFPLAKIIGFFGGLLPKPPLTLDQVRNLTRDNIAAPQSLGLHTLGITPTPMQNIVPSYLARYRKAK